MPRRTRSVPKYRLHKASGQAVVTLDGKDFYLGRHGTKASKQEYDRLTGEWLQNGRRLPQQARSNQAGATVVELANAYWKFAKGYYVKNGKPTDETASVKVAMKHLRQLYGRTPAAEFGPLALKNVRQQMIDSGASRVYINGLVGRIVRCFRWATENEMVPVTVYQALRTVTGLRKGKTIAPERAPVLPVDDAVIDKTLPFMPEMVQDMVRLQRLTGARPGEICIMRPADIDRSRDVWAFRPETHKMEHRGRERIIWIGPKAQDILKRYLLRPADQACFCTARTRKDGYGTRPYRNAIHRAVGRANRQAKEDERPERLPRWNPNQIRHTNGTEVRQKHGLEAAQAVLGHAKADITQVYAERDQELAMRVIRDIG